MRVETNPPSGRSGKLKTAINLERRLSTNTLALSTCQGENSQDPSFKAISKDPSDTPAFWSAEAHIRVVYYKPRLQEQREDKLIDVEFSKYYQCPWCSYRKFKCLHQLQDHLSRFHLMFQFHFQQRVKENYFLTLLQDPLTYLFSCAFH